MNIAKALTGFEVGKLYAQCRAQLATKKSLALDLTEVVKADFTGVAMLVSLTKEAKQLGADFKIVKVSAMIKRLIKVAKLEAALPLKG